MKNKNKAIFTILVSSCLIFTGCSQNYTNILNQYKISMIKADTLLTNYYNNLYNYNQKLYFLQKRTLNPQDTIDYQIAPEIIDTNTLPTTISLKDLQASFQAINGIKKYTVDLYLLYTISLKHVSDKTITDIIDNISDTSTANCWDPKTSNLGTDQTEKIVETFNNLTNLSEEVDVTPFAAVITPVTIGLKQAVDSVAENKKDTKRDKYISYVIKRANPIVNNYLSILNKNADNFQNLIEQNIQATLQNEIANYNTLVTKSANTNSANELLRLKRLDNITEETQMYYTIQKNNPKAIITQMAKIQADLVAYVENPNNCNSQQLLNDIKKFNNYVIQ